MLSGTRESSSEAWSEGSLSRTPEGRQGVAQGLCWGIDRVRMPELLLGGDEITFSSTFCHSQPPPLPRHWEGSDSRSWGKETGVPEGIVQQGIIFSGAGERAPR